MISLRTMTAWLTTINPGKVDQSIRETLIRYQREAFDVIDAHFTRTNGREPRPGSRDLWRVREDSWPIKEAKPSRLQRLACEIE